MHHPTDRIAHTTAFVIPVIGALARTKNSSMGPPCGMDPTINRTEIYISITITKVQFSFLWCIFNLFLTRELNLNEKENSFYKWSVLFSSHNYIIELCFHTWCSSSYLDNCDFVFQTCY